MTAPYVATRRDDFAIRVANWWLRLVASRRCVELLDGAYRRGLVERDARGLSREDRLGLQVDSILSALRTGAVINVRWWRPSWQAGYETGLRRAHESVTEEFVALGVWTPSAPRSDA